MGKLKAMDANQQSEFQFARRSAVPGMKINTYQGCSLSMACDIWTRGWRQRTPLQAPTQPPMN